MTIIFRANDGTEFNSEAECLSYENANNDRIFLNSLVDVNKIILADNNGDKLHYSVASEEGYNNAQAIICTTAEAVNSLHKIARYGGWWGYLDVKTPGIWVWNGIHFIKEGDISNG